VGGVLYERFHIYDKVFTLAPAPAPAGAEGFQTYVDTAQTSIDTILSQETDTDYSAEKRQMLASYAPGATYSRDDYTIDKALGPTVADPTVGCSVVAGPVVAGPTVAGPVVAGPTVAGPVVAGPVVAGPTVAPVCRIDIPPNMSPSGGSNNAYIAEQQIGYRFASPTQGDFTLQTGIFNLKTAFNMCSNNAKCVAFTFDSVKGELQQYEKIKERGSTEISTVPIFFNTQKTSDNIISVIMPGRDFTTNNMRIDAKNAIQSYIKNITTLQKENIYDKLFNTSLESSTSIDRLFGMAGSSLMELPREPRTLTECQGDLDSVDSVSDRRCLAALINKYSLSAPAPAPR
jgi:hypothetical protein